MVRFKAPLSEANGAGGRWVECPFDARETFGEARPAVVAIVNGHEVRTRLAAYGGRTYLGLLKSLREAAGISDGDMLDVEVRVDTAPREVAVPEELRAALDGDAAVKAAYDAMAFTHRKEYAAWVGEAKQAETRQRRAAKALEMIRAGQRRS